MELKTFNVCEHYVCIQGEGKFSGIPHLLFRFTGCNLRCVFGNSICDTHYTSFAPEKGSITKGDIAKLIYDNPHINYVMVTGGEPLLQKERLVDFVNTLRSIKPGLIITFETNGTLYQPGLDCPGYDNTVMIISPKLSNSIARNTEFISEEDLQRHRNNHANPKALVDLVNNYECYFKFVTDGSDKDMQEIKQILSNIIKAVPSKPYINPSRVWLMPPGITNEQLQESRPKLYEICLREGYNFSDRLQVVAFGDKRGV